MTRVAVLNRVASRSHRRRIGAVEPPIRSLRAGLGVIEQENIGYFDLAACPSEQQAEVRRVLATRLLPLAEHELAHVSNPAATFDVLRELADLSGSG